MTDYRARFLAQYGFSRDSVLLYLRDKDTGTVLMRDGTWVKPPEASAIIDTELVGVEFPADAITAIADAIREYQGNASDGATEARVLREWLAV